MRRASSCRLSGSPPTTNAAGCSCLVRNISYCATTCIASSRVGTSTSAATPGALFCDNFSITGIRNARVLPVPVWAVAITSVPVSACGMAAACTGVGVTKRDVLSFSFKEGEIESSEKLSILLSCWRSCWDAPVLERTKQSGFPDLCLNYAEDERRKLRAGVLRCAKPEGPHNPTACIKRGNSITQDRDLC